MRIVILPVLATLLLGAPAALRAADDKAPADLRKTIDEGVEMLEAKKFEPFLERFIAPVDRAKIPAAEWQGVVKGFAGRKSDEILGTLKATKKLDPEMTENGTAAKFATEPPLKLQKVEDKWRGEEGDTFRIMNPFRQPLV